MPLYVALWMPCVTQLPCIAGTQRLVHDSVRPPCAHKVLVPWDDRLVREQILEVEPEGLHDLVARDSRTLVSESCHTLARAFVGNLESCQLHPCTSARQRAVVVA